MSGNKKEHTNIIELAKYRRRTIPPPPDTDTEIVRAWLSDIRDLAMQVDVLLTLRECNKNKKAN